VVTRASIEVDYTDDIMSALVLRSLPLHNKVTPLYLRRTRRHLTNFTTSNQMSNSSIMQPKFSEGQDEAKVMEETRALIKNGWDLDDDGMGIRKTYHFKNYTKALVGWHPRLP
jgi:hypothetical protein